MPRLMENQIGIIQDENKPWLGLQNQNDKDGDSKLKKPISF